MADSLSSNILDLEISESNELAAGPPLGVLADLLSAAGQLQANLDLPFLAAATDWFNRLSAPEAGEEAEVLSAAIGPLLWQLDTGRYRQLVETFAGTPGLRHQLDVVDNREIRFIASLPPPTPAHRIGAAAKQPRARLRLGMRRGAAMAADQTRVHQAAAKLRTHLQTDEEAGAVPVDPTLVANLVTDLQVINRVFSFLAQG